MLLVAINKVREKWGKPMLVTSGLRSQADQERINPKSPKSKHIIGAAVDIKDLSGDLFTWCQANESFLKESGIKAIELGTKGWVHFQVLPTASGRFWFLP